MNVLLDTHIYIWWLKDDKKLSKEARSLIIEADTVHVSSASIWEAAIKIQLGKLDAEIDELVSAITEEGFTELSLTTKQAALVTTLPPYHRDPFDRLLIAQAIHEPLRFLTSDDCLRQYSGLVQIV